MKNIVLLWLLIVSVIYSQSTIKDQQNLLNFSGISVTIGGSFPLTGSFPALMTERVDQFITRIYNEAVARSTANAQDEALLEKLKKDLTKYSLRGITLKRSTGEEIFLIWKNLDFMETFKIILI